MVGELSRADATEEGVVAYASGGQDMVELKTAEAGKDARVARRRRFTGRACVASSGGVASTRHRRAALIATVLVFTAIDHDFFSGYNFVNILLQSAITAILAIAETFVIITAGIDLSIGSALALAATVSGLLLLGGITASRWSCLDRWRRAPRPDCSMA